MSLSFPSAIHPAVRRQTIADALRRTAIRLPAKTGIVCGATSWTYAEFDALVTRLAAGLAIAGQKPHHGQHTLAFARAALSHNAERFACAQIQGDTIDRAHGVVRAPKQAGVDREMLHKPLNLKQGGVSVWHGTSMFLHEAVHANKRSNGQARSL